VIGRRRGWGLTAVTLLLLGYAGTGVFTVAPDEQAVVRRFGRVTARFGPGMHYRLPWPVDQVNILKTTTVMKTGVGFELPDGEAATVAGLELLTGDTNIVSVAVALQFVIADPTAFLFEVEAPAALIGRVAESVLTETVIGMPVDEVLTTGRPAIQERVKVGTQAILDRYLSGIQLTSASIMTITFDSAVAQAFQDVASASADRENKVNEARTYANNVVPKARGEARSLVLAAQSYREQRVAEAVGNAGEPPAEPRAPLAPAHHVSSSPAWLAGNERSEEQRYAGGGHTDTREPPHTSAGWYRFLYKNKGSDRSNPEKVHHARHEQERHQRPAAPQAIKAVAQAQQQCASGTVTPVTREKRQGRATRRETRTLQRCPLKDARTDQHTTGE